MAIKKTKPWEFAQFLGQVLRNFNSAALRTLRGPTQFKVLQNIFTSFSPLFNQNTTEFHESEEVKLIFKLKNVFLLQGALTGGINPQTNNLSADNEEGRRIHLMFVFSCSVFPLHISLSCH